MKEELNTRFTSLGYSPINFVAQNKRVSHGKQKLEEMIQAPESPVADVLHIDKVVLEKQKPQHCCQDSSDLQSVMKLLKQKIDISTNDREKAKFLTLVPNS